MEENKTQRWWSALRGIAAFNLLVWCVLAYTVDLSSHYARWQLGFCGIFTVVCAFRSFRPRIDLERYCIVDSYTSSIVAGRSAATVAEISFACQVAMMLHELGASDTQLAWLQTLAVPVVVLLTIAQGFCWFSVLTKNHLGHAIEESLWAFAFAMVGLAMLWSAPLSTDHWVWITRSGVVLSAMYVLFMVTVDVPMYLRRWRSGEHTDERLSLAVGWSDALHRRVVTLDWKIWKPEVAWLTGYFSLAVWISMGMVGLPR